MMDDGGMHDDAMDHDEDDDFGDENDDDEDDVSLEEEEFNYELYENVMRRLGTNDPSLTILTVDGIYPPDCWGSLGRAIGMNTQLRGLTVCDVLQKTFFSGLAINRSILTLCFIYSNCEINGYMIEKMAPFLADNEVFKCLAFVLTDVNATTVSCLASFLLMFDYLENFSLSGDEEGTVDDLDIIIQALTVHTGLRTLDFGDIVIGRRGCDSLVKLLNKSSTLKEVALNYVRGITDDSDDGWQDIFTALQNTRCKLEKIEMRGVERLNERSALCLSDALLHHSSTLKIFHSNEGLRVGIPLLQDPDAILEELGQVNDDAPITNEELEALTVVLETNSSLKTLMLSATNSITTERWMVFSAVLLNPNSKLEILVLYDSHMDDTVMNSFADALTINCNLQQLCVGNCDSVTVNGGYAALTRTLCNKSSILSTYHSNHTLNMLDGTSTFLPEELSSLLQINKYNNKNQAARLKIIMSHFSGNDIKMEPFAKMAVNVRPHAIEWMAKDMHLYRFLRAMPSLLDKVEDEGHLFI